MKLKNTNQIAFPFQKISQSERAAIFSPSMHAVCQRKILHSPNKPTVFFTAKRYRDTHSTADRPKSGRRVTPISSMNDHKIREKIRRYLGQLKRKPDAKIDISRNSMWRIVRKNLHPFKYQKTQFLTPDIKTIRVVRSKELLLRLALTHGSEVVLSSELFKVLAGFPQEANECGRLVGRSAYTESLMVWVSVSRFAKNPLIFVNDSVKIQPIISVTFWRIDFSPGPKDTMQIVRLSSSRIAPLHTEPKLLRTMYARTFPISSPPQSALPIPQTLTCSISYYGASWTVRLL